jgi:outer membrane protein assembly factor BamD
LLYFCKVICDKGIMLNFLYCLKDKNRQSKPLLRRTLSFLSLIILTFTWGCSEYQQVLNSKDNERKFKKAKEYYNNDEFQKALTLFDDIRTYYRGTERGQKIAYYHAYCHFGVGSYRVAAFRFKTYYESYSRSDKAEDALYMHAFCLYKQSPRVELYQKPTREAISAFQLFLDKYPNSDRIQECNKYMDKLNAKLTKKAFQKAKLWYKILDYKAAITSFKNLLKKYPSIENREKVEFLIVDSYWHVAENSVLSKKEDRYQTTVQRAKNFLQTYPASEHKDDVKKILNQAQESLSRYNT